MTSEVPEKPRQGTAEPRRPHSSLMTYFVISSLVAGPAFPIVLWVRFLRYRTLQYVFDDEGVSMSWGMLFRREVSLTYARLQDIHLTSNVLERWFGLARLQLQTASGSAAAEMTIEGLKDFEEIRDHLYARMRRAHGAPSSKTVEVSENGETAAALREAAAELRALRLEMTGAGEQSAPEG